MDLDAFRASLSGDAPPARVPPPAAALWWDARGDWNRAHRLVMDDPSPLAAAIHAYLHRAEGDLGNAGYWYRRAGRPPATAALAEEWAALVAEALAPPPPG